MHAFISGQFYARKISKAGQINHFGAVYSVGRGYRHQWVQVRLTADGSTWEVLVNYEIVTRLAAHAITSQTIQNLTVFQRTNTKLDDAT